MAQKTKAEADEQEQGRLTNERKPQEAAAGVKRAIKGVEETVEERESNSQVRINLEARRLGVFQMMMRLFHCPFAIKETSLVTCFSLGGAKSSR